MNDLDLLERFRADLPPADPAALNRARARMFRTAAPASRSRWVWRLAPAAALATALGVAVVVVRADGPAAPGPAPAVAPVSEATRVLRLAASEALREPVLKARPDQFVYVESQVAWAGGVLRENGKTSYLPPAEKRRRIWLSVDGSRTGLLKETGSRRDGLPFKDSAPIPGGGHPAYARDLPTDSAKMRQWLYQGEPGDRGPDTAAWSKITDTLREQYVPPAAVAAIFEAAATIPGASEVKQVDLAGRHGIAVSRTDGGIRADLIFDAATYHFLGERDVVVGNTARPFPKGAVIGWTAQLKVAIVDRPGQSPS